jgi:hypothetical protein
MPIAAPAARISSQWMRALGATSLAAADFEIERPQHAVDDLSR